MIRINYKVFLKCYPGEVLFWAVGVIVGIVLLPTYLKAGGIVIGISIVSCIVGLMSWKGHFANGALLPAVVVNPKKNLIAVVADFNNQGGHSYPVVKIVKRPLRNATGAPFKKATRLATVATFHNKNIGNNKRWTDINPIVVNCVTASNKTIKNAVNAIDEAEWDILMNALKKMDKPFKAGIFPFDLE
ncbi:DUF3239 domain-containing protein [uncultured Gimesia sp.]|uniref:DUF3239 domain-containing protein n=1 Tax=uncultured Gimesia sp. TaxID=1678688 RepID=UPI00261FD8AA|nr:DUF3239 domain-containing protein [uncultured Gimesia sp.]